MEGTGSGTLVDYMQKKGLVIGEDLDEDIASLEESYENGLIQDVDDKVIKTVLKEFDKYATDKTKIEPDKMSIKEELAPLIEDQAAIDTLASGKYTGNYSLHDVAPAAAAIIQREYIDAGIARVQNALKVGTEDARSELNYADTKLFHNFVGDYMERNNLDKISKTISSFKDKPYNEILEAVTEFAYNNDGYIDQNIKDYVVENEDNAMFMKQAPVNRSVYVVDLKPHREQFLDWDLPLTEQSDYVIDKLDKALGVDIRGKGVAETEDLSKMLIPQYTGAQLVHYLEDKFKSEGSKTAPYDASMWLSDVGIPGSKHNDWMAKRSEASTKNWVVFKEEDTEIIDTFTRNEWLAKMDEVYDKHPILPSRKDELGLLSRTTARLANPTNKTNIEQEVKRIMGNQAKNVQVVQSQSELPKHLQQGVVQGAYDKGTVYLVADNIRPRQVNGLLLHEVGVHANMRDMLGKNLYNKLQKRVKRMAASDPQAKAALRKAEQFGTEPEYLLEETLAYLVEANPQNGFVKQAISAIKAWVYKNFGFGRLNANDITMLARLALKHNAPRRDQTLYSMTATEDYKSFEAKVDPERAPGQSIKQAMRGFLDTFRTGVIDSYDSLKRLDEAAHGKDVTTSENIRMSSWVRARMSHGSVNAVSAMLNYGRIKMTDEGLIMPQHDTESLAEILHQVGNEAEIKHFMNWIAANRAKELKKQGRENLFTDSEIAAAMAVIDDPKMPSRRKRWEEAYRKFNQHQKDVLDIAVKSGVLSQEEATKFGSEMYVPFYRVIEDSPDGVTGVKVRDSLARQQAYKKLKGGKEPLGNLLQNTIENFNHLIAASMKNNAAVQAMDNAIRADLQVAEETTEKFRDKKNSTFVLRDGKKVWYNINDPLVFNALSTLTGTGMNNFMMKVMRSFKRTFTNFTTATPQFIVANLIRDSIHSAAVANTGKSLSGKLTAPIRGTKEYSHKNKLMREMITSGGGFTFGHVYGDDADTILANIDREVSKTVKADYKTLSTLAKDMWDKYHSISNRGENANRYAVYQEAIRSGKTPMQAAFESRDLMDFSSRGAWVAVRVLTDIVPFLNARIQGLDVLYRKGLKPTSEVIKAMMTGKDENITLSDKQAAARFSTVAGVVILASMALYMAYKDDEDFKQRPDWDRDMYWWFKIGDNAFRIPKPFELGAFGTLAERGLEQMVNDEVNGKLFADRFGHMLSDTFSFNPIPQMLNPMINLYANKDDFTNTAIETAGMQRLSPSMRASATTTSIAKGLSAGLEATFGNIFGKDSKLVLSPVQIDYLVQSYLGGLGASASMLIDDFINIGDKPDKKWFEYQPFRRFYGRTDLASSRYISDLYEAADKAATAYADYREMAIFGDPKQAEKFLQENREVMAKRKVYNRVKRAFATFNKEMKRVRNSDMPSTVKRQLINELRKQKSALAKLALQG